MKFEHFIKLALNTAFRSKSKFRLGAVLVKKGRVLSFGVNDMKKSHPRQSKYIKNKEFFLGLHAELHAIIGVSARDLDESTLFVGRVLKNGVPALAKPCQACENLLREAGVREVYFTGYKEVGRLELKN